MTTTCLAKPLDPLQTAPPSATEAHPPASMAASAPPQPLLTRALAFRDAAVEYCVPVGLERNTEPYRRARLISGFGILGFVFGSFYATFYLLIGHPWGALIVAACSFAVAAVPFILRITRSLRLAGNLVTLILLLGFGALCAIEGGVRGHAIGWLAAVPLCAFLLVEGPDAVGWCALSIVATAWFALLDLHGIRLPVIYPAHWHQFVTASGYLGLTLFMSVLGFIFEAGRNRAFDRMESALENLSIANNRLKRVDAEKNDFLAVAAHDLKNPLGIVMGFAELISSGRDHSREIDQEHARYIIQAADRMIALITQLLDINAIEQGRFPLEVAPCDLGLVSSQVASSYSAAASRKSITLYAAGPLTPAQALGDPKAVYQILDNLLSNAIKYSPSGSDIFVRIRKTMDAVVWEVQDQGAGLTDSDQARLFQKFTKLSTRPTAGESSTGLGLSIVKMLAEAMHGAVTCQSRPGEGATFSLRLPIPSELEPPLEPTPPVPQESPSPALPA